MMSSSVLTVWPTHPESTRPRFLAVSPNLHAGHYINVSKKQGNVTEQRIVRTVPTKKHVAEQRENQLEVWTDTKQVCWLLLLLEVLLCCWLLWLSCILLWNVNERRNSICSLFSMIQPNKLNKKLKTSKFVQFLE